MAAVGAGIQLLSQTFLCREIETWEEKEYDINTRLLELEEEVETPLNKKRKQQLINCLVNLNKKIKFAKSKLE